MKFFRSLSVLLAIAASSSYAMAEGGGDRTFARMEQARQVAIANYQADQKDQAQEQCHQPKLQPCPRQAPRSSQPPWPSGDDQASAAQSGGLAGLAVM